MSLTAAVRDIEKERSSLRFPEEEDIKGAAEGFVRLQKTYKISTEDFTEGKIPGTEKVPSLTALDCYLIGHRLAQEGQFYDYSANWLEIALKKFEQENDPSPKVRKVDILDWLQYSYYHGGNPVRALEITTEVAELDPDFPTLESNLKFYTKFIADLAEPTVAAMAEQPRPPPIFNIGGHYEALCRGEGVLVSFSKMSFRHCTNHWNGFSKNRYHLQLPLHFEKLHYIRGSSRVFQPIFFC